LLFHDVGVFDGARLVGKIDTVHPVQAISIYEHIRSAQQMQHASFVPVAYGGELSEKAAHRRRL
jgi:hypothetical protein